MFVSMTSDEILTRTAQYQIQYTPARGLSRRVEREPHGVRPVLSIRHHEDGALMTRAQVRARRLYNIGVDDEDGDHTVAMIPSQFARSPPPFRVTTECSDDEADGAMSRGDWRAPNRIGGLPFESDSSDDGANLDDFGLGAADPRPRRRRRRSGLTLADITGVPEAALVAPPEATGEVGELLPAHARFSIERNKSKCTIRFDPPVSGRFILLKMWNPHRDPTGNIDIQAIIVKGFAGPRYFPSVDMR